MKYTGVIILFAACVWMAIGGDRTGATGVTVCVDGVEYVKIGRSMSVKYNTDNSVSLCKINKTN